MVPQSLDEDFKATCLNEIFAIGVSPQTVKKTTSLLAELDKLVIRSDTANDASMRLQLPGVHMASVSGRFSLNSDALEQPPI